MTAAMPDYVSAIETKIVDHARYGWLHGAGRGPADVVSLMSMYKDILCDLFRSSDNSDIETRKALAALSGKALTLLQEDIRTPPETIADESEHNRKRRIAECADHEKELKRRYLNFVADVREAFRADGYSLAFQREVVSPAQIKQAMEYAGDLLCLEEDPKPIAKSLAKIMLYPTAHENGRGEDKLLVGDYWNQVEILVQKLLKNGKDEAHVQVMQAFTDYHPDYDNFYYRGFIEKFDEILARRAKAAEQNVRLYWGNPWEDSACCVVRSRDGELQATWSTEDKTARDLPKDMLEELALKEKQTGLFSGAGKIVTSLHRASARQRHRGPQPAVAQAEVATAN